MTVYANKQDARWVQANGVALRYVCHQGEGPFYVLLHEMGGSLESWRPVAQALRQTGSGVLIYDQRGFGLSEKPVGAMDMGQHVADLLALLDALEVRQKVIVAGVAVGAGISLAFAARHPQRVSHVVALAPACGVASARRDAALAMAQRIADEGMRSAAASLFELAYPAGLRQDPKAYAQYRMAWLSVEARSLAAIYRMLAIQDLDADLRALTPPTLLVGGSYDALRPEAEIRRIAALCPQAVCLIAPTGHFMQVNSPLLVACLLQSLARDPAGVVGLVESHLSNPVQRHGSAGPAC